VSHDEPVISVDADSPTPPFEQVRGQIAAGIAEGSLAPGTRLPPVRTLAADLGLAANTVARAYRELESAGLVETRGRAGTVVGSGGDRAVARLQESARQYAQLARELGIAPGRSLALVEAALGMSPPTM
jgi:DNA-binding transcriptional regulator YhcF (GntR family)